MKCVMGGGRDATIVIARYAFGYLAYCCIMVSQILVFVTLLLRLGSMLHTAFKYLKNCYHYGVTNSYFFHTFVTPGIAVTRCVQLAQKLSALWCHNYHIAVTLFTLWSHCAELTKRSKRWQNDGIVISLIKYIQFRHFATFCRTIPK